MKEFIEAHLRKRFVRLHGEGAPHQADLYRCQTCGTLTTHNKISKGDVCCQGHVIPATPTWMETFRLLAMPYTI